MPALPKGTQFIVPKSGYKKYTALVPLGNGKIKRVSFGDRRYQHYLDRTPRSMGGGKWSSKNHKDKQRRSNYRSRASGQRCSGGRRCIDVRYSPACFSYYYLW